MTVFPHPSADAFVGWSRAFAATVPAAAARLLANCTYRYDLNDDVIRALSLYLDGPFTLVAALLALIGAHFAVKFLGQAGLNRELTAALYTLCLCDAFLIFTVMLYHSIEATGILVTGHNVMWNEQKLVLYTHGLVSAATTASTLLVVFVTFQRFLVVIWPLRYARVCERARNEFIFQRTSSTETRSAETSHNTLLTRYSSSRNFVQSRKKSLSIMKRLRPYLFPMFVVFIAFALNATVFFEFELVDCYMFAENKRSQHLFPTMLRQKQTYNVVRTTVMMATQTVGPISVITLLTVVTEYKVHLSLRARRSLFESQPRRQSIVIVEELRERLSRTVAIFIAVKFLILRSLPIFFDIYETFYGIESFGIVLTVLVRLSDFGIVLNAATNSLAYFGKARWLEAKLRDRLLRKRHTPSANSRWSAYSKSLIIGSKSSFDYSRKKTSSVTMSERPFNASPLVPMPPRPPSAPLMHMRSKRSMLPLEAQKSMPTSPKKVLSRLNDERETLLQCGTAPTTPSSSNALPHHHRKHVVLCYSSPGTVKNSKTLTAQDAVVTLADDEDGCADEVTALSGGYSSSFSMHSQATIVANGDSVCDLHLPTDGTNIANGHIPVNNKPQTCKASFQPTPITI